jgi:MYXO-CTERM domain-containing protein
VTGTAEAGATVVLSIDGAPFATVTAGPDGAFAAEVSAAEGEHVLSAVATDAAGNASPAADRPFVAEAPVVAPPPFDGLAGSGGCGCGVGGEAGALALLGLLALVPRRRRS